MTSATEAILGGHHDVAICGGARQHERRAARVSKPLTRALMEAQKGKTLMDASALHQALAKDLVPRCPASPRSRPPTRAWRGRREMAKLNGISREEQDQIALRSHQNAARAWDDGTFAAEVMHVLPPAVRRAVDRDNWCAPTPASRPGQAQAGLRPQARHHQRGNASPLTDARQRAGAHARVESPRAGHDPAGFVRSGVRRRRSRLAAAHGPVFAAPKALQRAGSASAHGPHRHA